MEKRLQLQTSNDFLTLLHQCYREEAKRNLQAIHPSKYLLKSSTQINGLADLIFIKQMALIVILLINVLITFHLQASLSQQVSGMGRLLLNDFSFRLIKKLIQRR